MYTWGFPGGTSVKEPVCQCRRPKRRGFDPWLGKIPWWRTRQPSPVFFPGESHGQRSLAGYSPWGHKELNTTEVTSHAHTHVYSIVNSFCRTVGKSNIVKQLYSNRNEFLKKMHIMSRDAQSASSPMPGFLVCQVRDLIEQSPRNSLNTFYHDLLHVILQCQSSKGNCDYLFLDDSSEVKLSTRNPKRMITPKMAFRQFTKHALMHLLTGPSPPPCKVKYPSSY